MRKIAVFTGTRAEYGLLYWLMKKIQNDPELTLQIIASGTHFSTQHGETWREIVADGFNIDAKIEMVLAADTPAAVIKSMGLGLIGFADALDRLKPELIVILGDRTEALAMAQVALIYNIPIIHLHGGEITLGAYDNAVRHAITKMAAVHCVATEVYRKRVIQMGEEPNRVFNVGALGLEHIIKTDKYPLTELAKELGLPLKNDYFLITYHSVTLEPEQSIEGCKNLLHVLDSYPQYQVLFTYPNADNGGFEIIKLIESYCKKSERAFIIKSLGFKKYLSAVQHAAAVIGNSSSGIIEVPSLGVPTINIGLRQQGRLAADSVIHCGNDNTAIKNAIDKSLTKEFKSKCKNVYNPYGDGKVSEKILEIIKQFQGNSIKNFQDMDVNHATI